MNLAVHGLMKTMAMNVVTGMQVELVMVVMMLVFVPSRPVGPVVRLRRWTG